MAYFCVKVGNEEHRGQVTTNHSIIIKEDKTIANAMYTSMWHFSGESEIWQDTSGRWHGPESDRN